MEEVLSGWVLFVEDRHWGTTVPDGDQQLLYDITSIFITQDWDLVLIQSAFEVSNGIE